MTYIYTLILLGTGLIMGQSVEQPRLAQRAEWKKATQWKLDQAPLRNAAEGRIHRIADSDGEGMEYIQGGDNQPLLAIRVAGNGGAALRAHFEEFHVPAGGRVFVYGLDNTGAVTRVAGPYEGAGPLGLGEFWSEAVPGVEIVVELQLREEVASLPFQWREVGVLDGMEEHIGGNDERAPVEKRVSWYRGMPVEHAVIDGYGVVEGDILMGRVEELERYEPGKRGERESFAISGSTYRWPSGVIPYTIDPALPTPSRVTDAIAHWNTNLSGTIRLVPRTNESAYVSIVRADSAGTCSSYVGRTGMAQPINFGDSCSTGNAIHEIGHAVGLYHEHTRTDRDKYVAVHLANVSSGMESNFTVVSSGSNLGSYDYGSIMHYPAYAFSANGLPTIDTIPAGIAIGQRNGLSTGDMAGVRAMYTTTAPTGTSVTVTLASNPTGRTLVVDGLNVVTPASVTWVSGSLHTVSAPDAVMGTVMYGFNGWSDGGAQTHTVTAPTSASTLTATYRTRYLLTTSASDPVKGGVGTSPLSANGFYDMNSTVMLNATAFSGSCFTTWSGILPVADFQAQITMDKAYNVMGGFQTGAVTFPTQVTVPQAGGTTGVSISATSGCLWKARTTANWIGLSTVSGNSSGVLQMKVSKNNTRVARVGTVVVNGVAVTVTQPGR